MAMIMEFGDFKGYDSKVPIQNIINFMTSRYNCRNYGTGYGDYSANISFKFNNLYYKFPKSLFGWIWYALFPKHYFKLNKVKIINEIKSYLKLNFPNVVVVNDSIYSLKLKYLKDEELNQHKIKENTKRKLLNF